MRYIIIIIIVISPIVGDILIPRVYNNYRVPNKILALERQENPRNLDIIYTNQEKYKYLVDTDADLIDYQLYNLENSGWKHIASSLSDIAEENPGKRSKKTIGIDLDRHDGTYKLEYFLLDNGHNSSRKYIQEIVLDKVAPKIKVVETYTCNDLICIRVNLSKDASVSAINQNKKSLGNLKPVGQKDKSYLFQVPIKWSPGNSYEFWVSAKDKAGNQSTQEKATIKIPKDDPVGGDVFGADQAHPYGRDSHYGRHMAYTTLHIIDKNIPSSNRYNFLDRRIPHPVLTFTETKDNSVYIYGQGPYKNQVLLVDSLITYPSYEEALKLCRIPLSQVFIMLKPALKQHIDCISSKIGVSNLDKEFFRNVENACNRLNLLARTSC